MSNHSLTQQSSDRMIAFWLMLTLATAFLFFFSGRFHSIDEVSSVALAETIITQGQAHTDQITWSQTWPLPQGTYGRDGVLYSKKGIGWSLLIAPLQALSYSLPDVGVVGMVMLTNWWSTALTGGLLYLLVRRLGYRQSTGVFVTLAWAFGTLALVYSKTLFNHPFVALVLVAVTWLLLPNQTSLAASAADPSSNSREGKPPCAEPPAESGVPKGHLFKKVGASFDRILYYLMLLLAGTLLGWVLITRPENALTVPLFALFLFFTSHGSITQRVVRVIVFGIPITLTVGFILWFNWFRFGSPLDFGYDMSEESGGNPVIGLIGILFSPGRSLFLYMPLLLPAWWGLIALLRSSSLRKAVSLLVLAFTAIYLFFFAPSVDWWGGWNWGIRYWLPLLPLWCLGLAPLWEKVRWRLPLILLAILSFLIQLLGVLIDFNLPLVQDFKQDVSLDSQLWTIFYSQIANHLRLLPNWQQWDIAWVVTNSWWLAVGTIVLLLGALWGLYCTIHGIFPRRIGPNRGGALSAFLLSGALLILVALTQMSAYDDPKWSVYHPDLAPLVQHLEYAPPNTVLLFEMHAYHDYFDRVQAWFNLNRTGVPHVQLLQQKLPDATQSALLERATKDAELIYLATEGTGPGDPNSGTERWLSERAFLAHDEWIGPYTRLTVFYTPSAGSREPVITTPLRLEDGIKLVEANKSPPVRDQNAGELLLISLHWQAEQKPSADYTIFVQLLGPQGVVAQQDGWPQANFAPTSSWQVGQIIEDKRALVIPDLPAGDYSLIAGMYDHTTGQRLAVGDQEHTISLGMVRIRE